MKFLGLICFLLFPATLIAATPQSKPVTPYNDIITKVDIDSGYILLKEDGEKRLSHPVYVITLNKRMFPIEALAPNMQIQYATDEKGIHFIVIQSTIPEETWNN